MCGRSRSVRRRRPGDANPFHFHSSMAQQQHRDLKFTQPVVEKMPRSLLRLALGHQPQANRELTARGALYQMAHSVRGAC